MGNHGTKFSKKTKNKMENSSEQEDILDKVTLTSQGPGTTNSQIPGTPTLQGLGTPTSQGPGTPISQGPRTPSSGTSSSQHPRTPTSLGPGTPTSQGSRILTSHGSVTPISQGLGIPTSQEFLTHTSMRSGLIPVEERFMFHLMKTLDELGCLLIKYIYNNASVPRNPSESLEEHILRTSGMSGEEFESKFNPEIRDLIARDPNMDSFDITALFTLLQYSCVASLAPVKDQEWLTPGTLENNLKLIKDIRNHLIHSDFSISEAEFYSKLEEQRTLLVNTALLAKSKCSLDEEAVTGMISWLHSKINNIRDNQFENIDWTSPAATHLIDTLKGEMRTELAETLESSSIVNPASLIAGRHLPMEVVEIFTPLEIVDESGQRTNVTAYGDDILKVPRCKHKNIILLEGVAGVGKTTIAKKLISDWKRGDPNNQVSQEDFVIPVQCRDRAYNSVGRITSALMPECRKKFFEDNHMTACLIGCKTFFILDGIDEITSDSKAILIEILEMLERKNIVVLMTTRPEKIREIYQMIPSVLVKKILHLRINGVAEINKEDFITKYHTKLKDLGVSTQNDASGLLTYLRTTGARLQDQWTLPLNLTLVTLLWGIDDYRILSVTCPVELSIAIREISRVRLEERVVHSINYTLDVFDMKIEAFFSNLSEIALFGIRDSDLLIPQNRILKLEKICSTFNLPADELFGAFLAQMESWSLNRIFMFAHKSGQEFYAAKHIRNRVFGIQPGTQKTQDKQKMISVFLSRLDVSSPMSQEITELMNEDVAKGKTITEVLTYVNRQVANPPSMGTYQNTMISLLGILHYDKVILSQEFTNEIIRLLKDAGVEERHHWIAVLNSVKCDPMVAKTLVRTVPNILSEGGGKDVEIRDRDVFAYATLLEHGKPKKVNMVIKRNPSDITRLQELCEHLAQGNIPIKILQLGHLFRVAPHLHGKYFISYLKTLLDKCPIEREYTGPLPSGGGGEPSGVVEGLRKTKELYIPLFEAQDVQALFSFLDWKETTRREIPRWRKTTRKNIVGLKPLKELGINIGKDVKVSHIPRKISTTDVRGWIDVFFPDVEDTREDTQRVSGILRNLLEDRYQRNPPSSPGVSRRGVVGGGRGEAIKRLLQSLRGIKVSESVSFPSQCRPSYDKLREELEEECKRNLGTEDLRWGGAGNGDISDLDSWE